MDMNSIVSAVTGNSELAVAINVNLLKKSQDIAASQASLILNAIPKASPSMPGIGQKIDLVG
jgi:hypothetical protein